MKKNITLLLIFITMSLLQAADEGSIKWTFSTGGEIYSLPAIGGDGTIYLASYDKYLYALNSDGSLKWKYHALTDNNWECFLRNAPALGSDGTVYFVDNSYGYLFAVGNDGTEKWKADFTDGRIAAPPAIGPNGEIIIVTTMREVFSVNPADGSINWKYTFSGGEDEAGAVIDASGAVFVRGGRLKKISPSGNEEWEFENGSNIYSSAIIAGDGTLYITGSSDKTLYALDGNGNELWNFTAGDKIYGSPVLGPDGTIYFYSYDGFIHAVNPDGTEKWTFDEQFQSLFGDIKATPIVGADSVVYFSGVTSDFSTRLFAINPDGSARWSVTLSDVVRFQATISRDSLLLVPQGNKLLAIKVGSAGLADSPFPKFRGDYANTGYVNVSVTAIGPRKENIPGKFSVSEVYPNPFNPQARIRLNLKRSARVRVDVYNATGRRLLRLTDGQKNTGRQELIWDASSYGSGVYFIDVMIDGVHMTRKALLVK